MKLTELEKKYEELGKQIERLKKEQKTGFKDDPIFLLSTDEYKNYKQNIPHDVCWWWLRTPGVDWEHIAYVCSDRSVYDDGAIVDYDSGCIRPALKISNLKSSNFKFAKEDRLIYCGTTWKKIGNCLYIAEMPIAYHKFDANSNDYENSEIRQFLLNWYKERKNW